MFTSRGSSHPSSTDPNGPVSDDDGRTPNNDKLIYIGFGIATFVVVATLVLFFRNQEKIAANHEVEIKVRVANEAAARHEWNVAIALLRKAISTPNATRLNEAHRLLEHATISRLVQVADQTLADAELSIQAKELVKATHLLTLYQANPDAHRKERAAQLLAEINRADSESEAMGYLQGRSEAELASMSAGKFSQGAPRFEYPALREVFEAGLLSQLPKERKRRSAIRRKKEEDRLANEAAILAKADRARREEAQAEQKLKKENEEKAAGRTKEIGGTYETRSPDSDGPFQLAVDDAAWDAMMQAALAKDTVGTLELMRNGKVFIVPSGTQVKLLDASFTAYKVRIMSGKHAGKSGWIPTEFVK